MTADAMGATTCGTSMRAGSGKFMNKPATCSKSSALRRGSKPEGDGMSVISGEVPERRAERPADVTSTSQDTRLSPRARKTSRNLQAKTLLTCAITMSHCASITARRKSAACGEPRSSVAMRIEVRKRINAKTKQKKKNHYCVMWENIGMQN